MPNTLHLAVSTRDTSAADRIAATLARIAESHPYGAQVSGPAHGPGTLAVVTADVEHGDIDVLQAAVRDVVLGPPSDGSRETVTMVWHTGYTEGGPRVEQLTDDGTWAILALAA